MLGAVLLLQLATVGDTIWVRRGVAAPPDHAVRAAEWRPEGEVEVLGRARIERAGDSVEVAYPVTVWAPGEHVVEVPGPLVIGPDGAADSLPPIKVTLSVASVLPAARPDSGLKPQPPAAPVPLREYTLLPLAWLLGAALLLLAPLHLWWRRRGRPPPPPAVVGGPPGDLPIHRWAEAGEVRAVVDAAAERLRDGIALRVPEADATLDREALIARLAERRAGWPLGELREVLAALDRARFAHAGAVDALDLYRRAEALERSLPVA